MQGILETSIAMFIAYVLLALVGLLFAKLLYNKQLLHTTFKLFMASVVLELIYFLIMMSEFSQFSHSGIWTNGLTTFGECISRSDDSVNVPFFHGCLFVCSKRAYSTWPLTSCSFSCSSFSPRVTQ